MSAINDESDTPSKVLEQIRPGRIALVVVTVLMVGVVFYHHVEQLKWLDSIYFCVVTLTTVGYGDIVPKTDAGKVFTVFYLLFGVGIIAASLSYLVKTAAQKRMNR